MGAVHSIHLSQILLKSNRAAIHLPAVTVTLSDPEEPRVLCVEIYTVRTDAGGENANEQRETSEHPPSAADGSNEAYLVQSPT